MRSRSALTGRSTEGLDMGSSFQIEGNSMLKTPSRSLKTLGKTR
jgi:hypothetical protein